PDQRGDQAMLDPQVDALECLELRVPEVHVVGFDAQRSGGVVAHPKIPLTYSSVRRLRGFSENTTSLVPTSTISPCHRNIVRSASRRACCTRFVTSTMVISLRSSFST